MTFKFLLRAVTDFGGLVKRGLDDGRGVVESGFLLGFVRIFAGGRGPSGGFDLNRYIGK